jgi:hypothetical protein
MVWDCQYIDYFVTMYGNKIIIIINILLGSVREGKATLFAEKYFGF